MPKRTDISSILVVCALCVLGGCNQTERLTPQACEDQFFADLGRDALDGSKQLVPTFTYDITEVEAEDLRSLLKTGEGDLATTGTSVSGSPYDALEEYHRQKATEAGSLFMADGISMFRALGKTGTRNETIADGCSGGPSGARLVAISWADASEGQPK